MPLKLKGADAPPPDPGPSYEDELRYGLREPNGPTEFDVFREELSADMRPHAKTLWQMGCEHADAKVVMEDASWTDPDTYKHAHCPRCGLLFKQHPTKAATKHAEWSGYCPDGYDAFEWEDLYTPDKTLWPFLYDAAEEAMVADSMTKED